MVLSGARQIVGVLCAHDLHGAEPGSIVGDIMSAPAVTLAPSANVQDAAKLLRRRNIGCLPLVDHGLAGIVSISDLLGLLGKGALRVQPRALPKRGPTHRPERRRA